MENEPIGHTSRWRGTPDVPVRCHGKRGGATEAMSTAASFRPYRGCFGLPNRGDCRTASTMTKARPEEHSKAEQWRRQLKSYCAAAAARARVFETLATHCCCRAASERSLELSPTPVPGCTGGCSRQTRTTEGLQRRSCGGNRWCDRIFDSIECAADCRHHGGHCR